MSALLTVKGLAASYGAAQVLFDVGFSVAQGEVITLLGRNGMGRSTTIKCLFGLFLPRRAPSNLGDNGWSVFRLTRLRDWVWAWCLKVDKFSPI